MKKANITVQKPSLSALRTERGQALSLVAMVTLTVILVGLAMFLFLRVFGGYRELQSATDSGSVNVAKQMLRSPTIALNPGLEEENFKDLLDQSGAMNLMTYNRIVAQTLLVGLNAKAEDTLQAATNAKTLFAAVQTDSDGLSSRLLEALQEPYNAQAPFTDLAARCNLKMAGLASSIHHIDKAYSVSYLKRGGDSNVYLDPSILPTGVSFPNNGLSVRSNQSGWQYIKGYESIDIPGIFSMQAASAQPGTPPHLIAASEFDKNMKSPLASGYVPPNAFRTAASISDPATKVAKCATAASVIGTLSNAFAASIPGGYLVISYGGNAAADTLPVLLSDVCGSSYTGILKQLKQRMREIQPSATDAQMDALLSSMLISPGQTAFIYLKDEKLILSTTPAPRYIAGITPDGARQIYSQGTVLVASTPDTSPGATMGADGAWYCPSSGFRNLLGSLNIRKTDAIALARPASSLGTGGAQPSGSSATGNGGQAGGGAGGGTGGSSNGGSSSGSSSSGSSSSGSSSSGSGNNGSGSNTGPTNPIGDTDTGSGPGGVADPNNNDPPADTGGTGN